MKIALVDDEPKLLDEMAGLVCDFGTQRHCHVETVPFLNAEGFFEAFGDGGFSAGGSFDAVFMDIYMDAFSCHAFEYIIKPFSPQRIFKVLGDILEMLPPLQKYIEVINGRKTIHVFLDEIFSVITDAHYLDIALSSGETLHCRMTMPEFVMLTDGDSRFLAINKGIMVIAGCILVFTDNCCVLENGAKLPIRVRDRLKIEQAARDYNFRKIRERQAHFAGRPVPEGIRKGD